MVICDADATLLAPSVREWVVRTARDKTCPEAVVIAALWAGMRKHEINAESGADLQRRFPSASHGAVEHLDSYAAVASNPVHSAVAVKPEPVRMGSRQHGVRR